MQKLQKAAPAPTFFAPKPEVLHYNPSKIMSPQKAAEATRSSQRCGELAKAIEAASFHSTQGESSAAATAAAGAVRMTRVANMFTYHSDKHHAVLKMDGVLRGGAERQVSHLQVAAGASSLRVDCRSAGNVEETMHSDLPVRPGGRWRNRRTLQIYLRRCTT